MYQAKAQHPLSGARSPLPQEVNDAMWRLFVAIGTFWGTVADPTPFRSRLQSFMANRIALMPLYADYYAIAKRVIDDLIVECGSEAAAYERLFTSEDAAKSPPTTPLALTRQSVSNEFVTLQMALGGFKAFEARNWPGYFGGTNIPGGSTPYRGIN